MTNKILVTGATGAVGSEVLNVLSISGANICAAVHSKSNVERIKSQGIDAIAMDYRRTETIYEGLRGVDKLFLVMPFQPNMVDLSSNLVKEARKTGVSHIVKLSAIGAEAKDGITVGRMHRQEEKLIEESELAYTFLRPNAFMQNFINFYGNTIRNQSSFYVPAGEGKVGFVDVRDVAAVAAKALIESERHVGKAYEISGAEALSYAEAAKILSREVGRRINYVNISESDFRQGMKDIGMDELLINSAAELFTVTRAGHSSKISPVVEEITDRKPILFNEFARDNVRAFR